MEKAARCAGPSGALKRLDGILQPVAQSQICIFTSGTAQLHINEPCHHIFQQEDGWPLDRSIFKIVVAVPPVVRDGRSESRGAAQMLRASQRKIAGKNIAVAIHGQPAQRIPHANEVVGGNQLAQQGGVL